MADEQDIKFKLDLDASEFIATGLEAKEVVKSLGDSENISGLLEGLASAGVALGSVGVAAFAFKEAIDWTVEAEQIQRVEKSFQTLAENAGISAEDLKQGMIDASGGLVSTNDLLNIANDALVKMGSSANQLPEIMELARKATAVFGGDLTSNFENITNAIANGNTKMLKHYGILVDSKKAMDDFAKANDLAVNEISATGKQQAILNAALEQGKKAFSGVGDDVNSATSSLQILKATFKDLGEAFVLAFEKTIGPGIRSFLTTMQHVAADTKLYMQSAFGDEATKAAANVKLMQDRVDGLQKTIADLEKKKGTSLDLVPADTISRLQVLPAKLKDLQGQLEKLKEVQTSLGGVEKDNGEQSEAQTKKDIANEAIHLANAVKFKAELEKLDKAYLQAQMVNVKTFQEIDENVKAQNELAEKEHLTRIAEIRRNQNLNRTQQDALIAAEEKTYAEQQLDLEFRNDALRKAMLTNYVKYSTSVFQGIGHAFEANSKKMQMEMVDFGKRGQEVWDSFAKNSTSAFEQMGAAMAQGKDIGQATADALKSIFLNMLADRAIGEGSILLLSSIWPPNPIGAAAGAGLIALGGALKSLAGGAGSSSSTPSVSGAPADASISGGATSYGPISSTSSSDTSSATASAQLNMAQTQAPQRIVNVNIAGNYMETDATRRQLMELMRQETDATSFTYNQIGV